MQSPKQLILDALEKATPSVTLVGSDNSDSATPPRYYRDGVVAAQSQTTTVVRAMTTDLRQVGRIDLRFTAEGFIYWIGTDEKYVTFCDHERILNFLDHWKQTVESAVTAKAKKGEAT